MGLWGFRGWLVGMFIAIVVVVVVFFKSFFKVIPVHALGFRNPPPYSTDHTRLNLKKSNLR